MSAGVEHCIMCNGIGVRAPGMFCQCPLGRRRERARVRLDADPRQFRLEAVARSIEALAESIRLGFYEGVDISWDGSNEISVRVEVRPLELATEQIK